MLNSSRPKPAQPRAAPWSPSSHDPRMSLSLSLSHGICVPSLKINTTRTNEVLTIVTTPAPMRLRLSQQLQRSARLRFRRGPRHPAYSKEENTSRNGWEVLRTTKSSMRWLVGRPAHAGDLLMTLGGLQAARYERRVFLRPASKQHVTRRGRTSVPSAG